MGNSIKELKTAGKLIRVGANNLKEYANVLAHKASQANLENSVEVGVLAQTTWEIAQKMYDQSQILHSLYHRSKKQGLKDLPNEVVKGLILIHRAFDKDKLLSSLDCSLCVSTTSLICYFMDDKRLSNIKDKGGKIKSNG
jgi:hypothetical protein